VKNLHWIRCYGKQFNPEDFKGRGLRGWWVRVLNRLRFLLERRVVCHTLILLASDTVGDLADHNAIVNEVERDTQPKRTRFAERRVRFTVPSTGSIDGHRQLLKDPGRIENPKETTERVMQNYAADPRQRRYAMGRTERIMMEAETINEVVDNGQTEQSASSGTDESSSPAYRAGRARPVHPEYAAENLRIEEDSTDEPETDIEAERRSSQRSNYRSVASAVKEHQRRILQSEVSPRIPDRDDQSGGGHDAERSQSAGSTGDQPEERAEAPGSSEQTGDTGTEARSEPVGVSQ
jgi:hypothetical protein